MFCYLFTEPDVGCNKSIALAVDGRVSTPSNGVHFPMGVVIVDHMEIPVSASWHSLDKPFSKVIKGYGDLHVLVLSVGIAVPQEHDFIMVGHVIVRNGDGGGPMNGVDKSVVTIGQRIMVHPYVSTAEDGHAVTIGYSPPAKVLWGVSHHSIPSLLAIVYV